MSRREKGKGREKVKGKGERGCGRRGREQREEKKNGDETK